MEISREDLRSIELALHAFSTWFREGTEDTPGETHPAVKYEEVELKLHAFLEPFENFDLKYHIIKSEDMPTLTKQYTLSVTPEQFLEACSGTELHEVHLLLFSKRFQDKMYPDKVSHFGSPEDQLSVFRSALSALLGVPENMRSMHHADYLKELYARVDELTTMKNKIDGLLDNNS